LKAKTATQLIFVSAGKSGFGFLCAGQGDKCHSAAAALSFLRFRELCGYVKFVSQSFSVFCKRPLVLPIFGQKFFSAAANSCGKCLRHAAKISSRRHGFGNINKQLSDKLTRHGKLFFAGSFQGMK
jgi:hypothetical protein